MTKCKHVCFHYIYIIFSYLYLSSFHTSSHLRLRKYLCLSPDGTNIQFSTLQVTFMDLLVCTIYGIWFDSFILFRIWTIQNFSTGENVGLALLLLKILQLCYFISIIKSYFIILNGFRWHKCETLLNELLQSTREFECFLLLDVDRSKIYIFFVKK